MLTGESLHRTVYVGAKIPFLPILLTSFLGNLDENIDPQTLRSIFITFGTQQEFLNMNSF